MINSEAIPECLRTLRRWVGARLEERGGRTTKVPYCAFDPSRRASSTDSDTWSDFKTIVTAIERGAVPLAGFVLGDGIVGVDLDHVRDPKTGTIEPDAQAIIDDLDSYAEVSVSGSGIHILCRGSLPAGGRRRGQVEMYESARYFVMTGAVVRPGELTDRTAALAMVHERVFKTPKLPVPDSVVEPAVPVSDDEALLEAIRQSKQGAKFTKLWSGDTSLHGGDDSVADLALCTILSFWTRRDRGRIDRLFRQSGLFREKWERADYRKNTLDRACAIQAVRGEGLVLSAKEPLKSAREFIARNHTDNGIRALQYQSGVFYAFERAASVYRAIDEQSVRSELYRFLDTATTWDAKTQCYVPFNPNKSKIESVLHALCALCNLPEAMGSPCWLGTADGLDPAEFLPCRNGLLHVPSRTLRPATAAFFSLNGLDISFDAQAPIATQWLSFLESLWPHDRESIDTLQEIFGYVLGCDTSQQKIFAIIGPMRSGKGTIGQVMRRTVGEQNYCAPTLAAFGNNFGKQVLIHKSLAIIGDPNQSKSRRLSRDKFFTKDEVTVLLTTTRQHYAEWYPYFLCGLRTGLRMGELLGLQWGDIDWHRSYIHVQRAWVRSAWTTPKSGSDRTVDMSSQLRSALRLWRLRQSAEWLRRGLSRPELVFPSRARTPHDHSKVRKIYLAILRKAELRHRSLHAMRHSFISLLLQNGESPAYVQKQVGHQSMDMTINVYGHFMPGGGRAAVDKLDDNARVSFSDSAAQAAS